MITIIENKKGINLKERFKELIDFRELLWTLAYRDFKVKYSQTLLGGLWAIIEPLATAILLSIVFNKIAKANTYNINPILFGLSGMIVWNYFSNVISQGSNSLILAQNMIKKIYFPRILIPASKAIAAIPDLIIALVFTILFYFIYYHDYTWNILLLPVFILLAILSALGIGILFSAMNIRYRDFQHIVPFLTRIGLFITPIAYSVSDVPENYKWLFFINPMTGVIEGMRWCFFNINVDIIYFSISLAVNLLLLIFGFYYFNKMEKNIADII
ncbi:MAG: ABC transporter permease [Saprospiraceae bacterium]